MLDRLAKIIHTDSQFQNTSLPCQTLSATKITNGHQIYGYYLDDVRFVAIVVNKTSSNDKILKCNVIYFLQNLN